MAWNQRPRGEPPTDTPADARREPLARIRFFGRAWRRSVVALVISLAAVASSIAWIYVRIPQPLYVMDTGFVSAMALSLDDRELAAVEPSSGKIEIYDLDTGRVVHVQNVSSIPDGIDGISAMAFSADGGALIAADGRIIFR